MTEYEVADTPGSSSPDFVALDLYERAEVRDDGTFEVPDELDTPDVRRRLEEAGHKPVATDASDDEAGAATDEDVEDAADELDEEEEEDEPDDEYADMDRSDLYELYKDRGGPESWNDTDAGFLRRSLRVHDEHGTFPTLDEKDDS